MFFLKGCAVLQVVGVYSSLGRSLMRLLHEVIFVIVVTFGSLSQTAQCNITCTVGHLPHQLIFEWLKCHYFFKIPTSIFILLIPFGLSRFSAHRASWRRWYVQTKDVIPSNFRHGNHPILYLLLLYLLNLMHIGSCAFLCYIRMLCMASYLIDIF